MPAPLRDVPADCVELIKSFEGIADGDTSTVNLDAYLCPAGVWTIGWGHALVDGGVQLKGLENKPRARALYPGGITRQQAEALLRADLIPRAAVVSSLLKVTVNDGEFGALIALVFNIGAANLEASTLLRLLNAGDRAGAADQFPAWDKARVDGVLQSLPGLLRRRKAERAMFLGEDWRAAAVPATRGLESADVDPLPVPEMPDADRAALRRDRAPAKSPARPVAAKKVAVKKKAAVKPAASAKKAVARKPAAKPQPAKKAAVKKATVKKAAPRRPR